MTCNHGYTPFRQAAVLSQGGEGRPGIGLRGRGRICPEIFATRFDAPRSPRDPFRDVARSLQVPSWEVAA
jgi:hypothetical protein